MMDGSGTMTAAPQNLAEVEQLVKRLYDPRNSPELVKQINGQLLRLQLSQDGWRAADELMSSDVPSVRFFAALTFTVKLNREGDSLDQETTQTVLKRIIHWLIQQVQHGERGLVTKKLCSALTTYFVRSHFAWTRPILHLAQSFRQGDATSTADGEENSHALQDALAALDPMQLRALLWFASTLPDEVAKMDSNLPAHARSHKEMESAVVDASVLMRSSFSRSGTPELQTLRREALRCYLNWVNYAQPIWPRKPEALEYLRDLVQLAAQCITDEELCNDALDLFRDILEGYTSFLKPAHVAILADLVYDHVRPALAKALAEEDVQSIALGQLVIAFGCAFIDPVVQEPSNERSSAVIIQLHFDILSAPGFPGYEDELSIQSIEFWHAYIEFVNDSFYSDSDARSEPPWTQSARAVLGQAIELFWKKMWIPPMDVRQGSTDSEAESFKEFRLEASDLMLSFFVFLGPRMLQQLVSVTLQSLENKHWRGLEAAMFCLNTLADNVLEDMPNAGLIDDIFRSSLFREVADFSHTMPLQARRTAIDLLGSYGQYIEHHADFLPDTLRFLFASLEKPPLASTAAKSICSLCSACRNSLTGEVDNFLAQYAQFTASPAADAFTKEKVIGAIAVIVQAIRPESAKVQPLIAMISHVEEDIASAKQYADSGEPVKAEEAGVTALQCLASIGEGLQIPDDVPINVDDDRSEQTLEAVEFWESASGQAAKQQIMGCFSALQVVGGSGTGIEAACRVIKSGLRETIPGPFVLSPSVIVEFMQQCTIHTPQLESVLGTAGMLVTQHSRPNGKRIDDQVAAIFTCVIGFVQTLGQPDTDPGVAHACILLLVRFMPYYTHLFFGEQGAAMFDFTIAAMESTDTFTKRQASDFWTRIMRGHTSAMNSDVQDRMRQVMEAYGAGLSLAVTRQIGGQAQRSELDFICEPLKALLLTQARAQSWLQQGLTDSAFPGANVSIEERERFLRQLSTVRSDGRRIKELTKAFWAGCRGTVASYTS